tara:strand:+ start:1662 stop:2168 length:507 start_codon:yes stop_codon:yes gene_type:complete
MSSIEDLIANYYRIKNFKMDKEKYDNLLRLYSNIDNSDSKFFNQERWYNIYVHNKNSIPESVPSKVNILKQIKMELNVNYLELIYNYYNFLDSCNNIKKISKNIIKEFEFTIFVLSKQGNINFTIDENIWKQLRQKCLVNKNKTKMPREPITLNDVICDINNILSINK